MNHRRTKLPRAAVSVDFLIYWLQRVAVPAAFFDLLCHTGCASARVYCIFFSNWRRFSDERERELCCDLACCTCLIENQNKTFVELGEHALHAKQKS